MNMADILAAARASKGGAPAATAMPAAKPAVIEKPAKAAIAEKSAPKPAPAKAVASTPAASPSATKIAAEKGIDTTSVQGTGRDGRVTKGDVLEAKPAAAPAQAALAPRASIPQPALGGRTEQRVPMSRLRQRIAERLVQSQSTAAILTTFNEVNMAPVMEVRNC